VAATTLATSANVEPKKGRSNLGIIIDVWRRRWDRTRCAAVGLSLAREGDVPKRCTYGVFARCSERSGFSHGGSVQCSSSERLYLRRSSWAHET